MVSFIGVKDLLWKIGTKEKPINPWKYFLGLIISVVLFASVRAVYKFMIENGITTDWVDLIFTFVFICPTIIAMIFYSYGLYRYSFSKNK